MSDINRSGNELVLGDPKLKYQHIQIMINEYKSQHKNLDLQIERLKTIDLAKLELAKAKNVKLIEKLEYELKQVHQEIKAGKKKKTIIDGEVTDG